MSTDQTLCLRAKQMIINARNLLKEVETIIDVMFVEAAYDDGKIDKEEKKQLIINEGKE